MFGNSLWLEIVNNIHQVLLLSIFKQDAAMNKITRNLSELQVRDVGVRADFTANVPRARRELSTLNQYRTPLEKLHCLRRTIMAMSQPGFRSKTPCKWLEFFMLKFWSLCVNRDEVVKCDLKILHSNFKNNLWVN